MCPQEKKCPKPVELRGKPEECSPGQIKKCDGHAKEHPCLTTADKE